MLGEKKSPEVAYVRLQRKQTDSWLTLQCPYIMKMSQAEKYYKNKLPGWTLVTGSMLNPDEQKGKK